MLKLTEEKIKIIQEKHGLSREKIIAIYEANNDPEYKARKERSNWNKWKATN